MDAKEPVLEAEFEKYLFYITHDLKSAMRAINTLPDWILADLKDSQVQLPHDVMDHFGMLKDYASRVDRMMAGLTDWSRVGRMADAAVVHDIRVLVDIAWGATPGTEGFQLTVDDATTEVCGPQNELLRLFGAVLSNCVVHHDRSVGKVSVRAETRDRRVHVTVTDDGPGLPKAFHHKAFEPLQTMMSKDERPTAGMGLTVAQKIVRNMGGSIGFVPHSATRGAIIEFDLPQTRLDA